MDKAQKKTNKKKQFCTIALSKETHELIKKEAEKTRRTVGVTATMLIEEGLALRS